MGCPLVHTVCVGGVVSTILQSCCWCLVSAWTQPEVGVAARVAGRSSTASLLDVMMCWERVTLWLSRAEVVLRMQWRAELVPAGLGSLLLHCGGEKPVPMFSKRCFLVGRSESQRNKGWNSLLCLCGAPCQVFEGKSSVGITGIGWRMALWGGCLSVLLVLCLVFVLSETAAWE